MGETPQGEPVENPPTGSRHVRRLPIVMELIAVASAVAAIALFLADAWFSGFVFVCLSGTWFMLARSERLRRETIASLEETRRLLASSGEDDPLP